MISLVSRVESLFSSSLFRFLKSSITLAAAIQALGPVRVESSVLSHGFPLRRICTSPLLNSYKYFSSIMICSDMFSPYFRLRSEERRVGKECRYGGGRKK